MFCKVRVRSVGYEICYKTYRTCRVIVRKSYRTHKICRVGYDVARDSQYPGIQKGVPYRTSPCNCVSIAGGEERVLHAEIGRSSSEEVTPRVVRTRVVIYFVAAAATTIT